MAEPYPVCYLDGGLVPLAEARTSPLDRGFLFADGVYEVVPVHRGRPFRLREHLERLARSLAAIRLPNPHTAAEWAGILARVAAAAGGDGTPAGVGDCGLGDCGEEDRDHSRS